MQTGAPALFSAGGDDGGSKHCFDYSLTVVHFRKLRNKRKVGSDRNDYSVI